MIRGILIFFACVLVMVFFLKRAKKQTFVEIFNPPKYLLPLVLVAAAFFSVVSLLTFAPYMGDPYNFGTTNSVIFTGGWPRNDGHEFSIAIISGLRILFEHAFTLSLSASTILITFLFALFYSFATYRLVMSGTENKMLALLAAFLTPSTLFTFMFVHSNYAQFLSLSFFLLGASFYLKKSVRPAAVFFSIAVITHVWSGAVFGFVMLTFLLLFHRMRLRNLPPMRTLMIRTWFIPILVLITFQHWHVFLELEFNLFVSNPLFHRGFIESPLVVITAILGLITIVQKKHMFSVFLFSTAFFAALALFFHSSDWVDRILFLVPFPVFVAFGVYRAATKIRGKWRMAGVIGLVGAITVSSIYANAIYTSGVSQGVVNLDAMDEIQGIVNKYGYDNSNILLWVKPPNHVIRTWAESLTRMKVWYGDSKDMSSPDFKLLSENRLVVELRLRP